MNHCTTFTIVSSIFCFEFPKDEVDWPFLAGLFQYLVHVSKNPHKLEYFEPLPKNFGVRASKSATGKVAVPSDPSSPSHKITLVPQAEVGDIKNSSIDIPPSPPTPHTHNFSLDCEYDGYIEVLSPHPPSFGPYNPPYCEFFFSHVSNISFEFHEDQVLDGFGVE